ncbi:uridine kinase [Catellatospora methionotrophica]|uniref:uridine kinase n=1 Tax=Catellatospora methionotrophica TaxID=121620 RepID=UPI0033D2D888
MRVRSVTPDGLVDELVERIAAIAGPDGFTRVALDGAPAAGPDRLAEALVEPLRALGHEVLHVRTEDFLRPKSVRWEFGRTNADSYYEGWLDDSGLRREVLDPLGPGGSGRVLPTLRDPVRDRATRAAYLTLRPGAVLLVSGDLLLGAGLPFELTAHLVMSAGALARHTPPELDWALPAYARYADEVAPQTFADLVVKVDDARHPAIMSLD